MLIGYARISTYDQTLSPQKDALQKAGCEKIFTDTVSGTKAERKGLQEAFSHLREGDTLDRKSTRLNSSHANISYAVFCLKKNHAPSSVSSFSCATASKPTEVD